MIYRSTEEAEQGPDSPTLGDGVRRSAHGDARATVIAAIAAAMTVRGLTQVQAARLCQTDQPTLSKVLRGRTESVTLDKLVGWLLLLGRSVEIRISGTDPRVRGTLTTVVDERGR